MGGITVRVSGMAELLHSTELPDSVRGEMEDALGEEVVALQELFRGDGQPTRETGRGDGIVPIETGRLLNSLNPDHDGLSVVIRSRVPYAEFAHFTDEEVGQAAEDVGVAFQAMADRVEERWGATLDRHLGADRG